MNFDEQAIVREHFLDRGEICLLVDGATYFTETYHKMHCITTGCTIPPQKYWNIEIINAWQGHEVCTLEGKKFGLWKERLQNFWTTWPCSRQKMDNVIQGRMIIITVFPRQYFAITHSYRYNTENYVVLLQKSQKQPLEMFCKGSYL